MDKNIGHNITKTQKINNYLNDTVDINDRVQNIISSFSNGENSTENESNINEDNAPNMISKQEKQEKLKEYYENLSEDDKNKIVDFMKDMDKKKSNGKAKRKDVVSILFMSLLDGISWIFIAIIHTIRYIGLGITFVLLPYSIFRWAMRENEQFNSAFSYGNSYNSGYSRRGYTNMGMGGTYDRYRGYGGRGRYYNDMRNNRMSIILKIVTILFKIAVWIYLYYLYSHNVSLEFNSIVVNSKIFVIAVICIMLFSITPLYKMATKNSSKKKELKKHEPKYSDITADDITFDIVKLYVKKNKIKL